MLGLSRRKDSVDSAVPSLSQGFQKQDAGRVYPSEGDWMAGR